MQFFPDNLQLHSNSCSEFSYAVDWLGGHPTESGFLHTPVQLWLDVYVMMVVEY